MHYHIEVVIPPTDDVEKDIATVLEPYDEQGGPDLSGIEEKTRDEIIDLIYEASAIHSRSFWDWYQIGGRWSGEKRLVKLDQDRIAAFRMMLNVEGFTISGVQAGAPVLEPSSQIETVDALWAKWFPDHGEPCPLFEHGVTSASGDICTVGDLPEDLTASRVLIACPSAVRGDDDEFEWTGPLKVESMDQADFWNGSNIVEATWDGKVKTSIERFNERLSRYAEGFRNACLVTDDHLVVTVDVHS